MVSTSETYASGLVSNETNPLFRQSQSFASMSQYAPSPEVRVDPSSMSQLALPPARGGNGIGRDHSPVSTDSEHRLDRLPSDDPSSYSSGSQSHGYGYGPQYSADPYGDEAEAPILPPNFPMGQPSSPDSYIQPPPAQYGRQMYAEPEGLGMGQVGLPRAEVARPRQPSGQQQPGRGVSLVDTGPVPAANQVAPHDPVRRVSKHTRKSSSRQVISPISSTSHASNLPPGAVSYFLTVYGALMLTCRHPHSID